MNSTDYITKLIKDKFKSVRQFSFETGIPYTTIKSGLAKGIGGMAIDTVIKMCDALGITVEELRAHDKQSPGKSIPPELQEIGVEWMWVAREAKKSGLTPEQVSNLIQAVKKVTDVDKK